MGIERTESKLRHGCLAALAQAIALVALLGAAPAHASFHTWRIAELYSDATGNVQFIELHEAFNSDFENLFAGHALTSTQGATTRVYTFPTNLPSTSTANKRLLIATAGYASLGVVTPDFIVPAPFLFPGGGSLDFASVDSVVYPALPIGGVNSLDRDGVPGINSPTNYAGQTGSVQACFYWLLPADLPAVAGAGGTPGIVVTTPAGCAVAVTTFQSWVTLGSVTPNGGSSTVLLNVAPNGAASRATSIVVADRLFLVTQLPGP